jgi:ribonucleotide monophosphatase NagD (HAD superfamily)
MGFDIDFNYQKMCLICLYLQKGLKFIGTNPDKGTIIEGFRVPGAGSMIKSV